MTLEEHRDRADTYLLKYRTAAKQVEDETRWLKLAEQSLKDALEAQKILQSIAQQIQEVAHDRMASVVTKCLQAVFPEPYEFRIVFEQKRGKTEAKLTFARDGVVLEDPLNEASGGMVQIAAFALVVATLCAKRPAPAKVLIMDEPFPGVAAANADRVREMLEVLSQDLGMQFVLATHVNLFETGSVYLIKKPTRKS